MYYVVEKRSGYLVCGVVEVRSEREKKIVAS